MSALSEAVVRLRSVGAGWSAKDLIAAAISGASFRADLDLVLRVVEQVEKVRIAYDVNGYRVCGLYDALDALLAVGAEPATKCMHGSFDPSCDACDEARAEARDRPATAETHVHKVADFDIITPKFPNGQRGYHLCACGARTKIGSVLWTPPAPTEHFDDLLADHPAPTEPRLTMTDDLRVVEDRSATGEAVATTDELLVSDAQLQQFHNDAAKFCGTWGVDAVRHLVRVIRASQDGGSNPVSREDLEVCRECRTKLVAEGCPNPKCKLWSECTNATPIPASPVPSEGEPVCECGHQMIDHLYDETACTRCPCKLYHPSVPASAPTGEATSDEDIFICGGSGNPTDESRAELRAYADWLKMGSPKLPWELYRADVMRPATTEPPAGKIPGWPVRAGREAAPPIAEPGPSFEKLLDDLRYVITDEDSTDAHEADARAAVVAHVAAKDAEIARLRAKNERLQDWYNQVSASRAEREKVIVQLRSQLENLLTPQQAGVVLATPDIEVTLDSDGQAKLNRIFTGGQP